MLQEIRELQNDAISSLISKFQGSKKEIIFKAPTGSGKTYMIADFMNRILEIDENIVFIVSSLSKGELAKQNYDKFKNYKLEGYFENINPYNITSDCGSDERLVIDDSYNVYTLSLNLYRSKTKLMKGPMLSFLELIKNKGKRICLIKDECHIATSKLDEISHYFEKVIEVSATPNIKRGQYPDVELTEENAVNSKLIKSVEYNDNCYDIEDLRSALRKYIEIKKLYINKVGINPCMIIQISNKEKADNEVAEIKQVLNETDFSNLKWMLLVDKDKECDTNDVLKNKKLPVSRWKEYAKRSNATIDIIIFKLVITEGWDIPRANMLYQKRTSQSKQLDDQVIGRVRRNPLLLDFEKYPKEIQDLVTKAYVWGVRNATESKSYEVKRIDSNPSIRDEIRLKTTRLKKIGINDNVNLKELINREYKEPLHPDSIFDLWRKYNRLSPDVANLCMGSIHSYNDWIKLMICSDSVSKSIKDIQCNYKDSMSLTMDENGHPILATIPDVSYFTQSEYNRNIDNWLWERTDSEEEFSFDSEAEKKWVEKILKLTISPNSEKKVIKQVRSVYGNTSKLLFGKNFISNSQIKYAYYSYGEHYSYPDFVMKDCFDRIHLFETKSLNKSSKHFINGEDYENKIIELKKCYSAAADLTGYDFYIPIQKESEWYIWKMSKGKEPEGLSEEQFITYLRNK